MSPLHHKILRDKKDILKRVSFFTLNNGGLLLGSTVTVYEAGYIPTCK